MTKEFLWKNGNGQSLFTFDSYKIAETKKSRSDGKSTLLDFLNK